MKISKLIIIFTLFFSFNIMAQQSVKTNVSLLFIGNSYTFMNDMPLIFQKMANASGYNCYVDTEVEGGKNLKYHAENPITYQKIHSRNWTYVVIQGHSIEFAAPQKKIDELSKPYLTQIIDSVRSNNSCTKIILYMTWGYKNGNSWEEISTYDKMQDLISKNYRALASEYNTIVSPVGEVWKAVSHENKDINLYFTDEKHPSLYGSFLSATTFFATITRKSPVGVPLKIDLDPKKMLYIEEKVKRYVTNNLAEWRNYPDADDPKPGFDVVINGTKLKIYNNSDDGYAIKYNVEGRTYSGDNQTIRISGRGRTLQISQTLDDICKSVTLTRIIPL